MSLKATPGTGLGPPTLLCVATRDSLLEEICDQIDKLIIHLHATYTPSELGNVSKSKLPSSLAAASSVAISPSRA
jgi:hypothetical protein